MVDRKQGSLSQTTSGISTTSELGQLQGSAKLRFQGCVNSPLWPESGSRNARQSNFFRTLYKSCGKIVNTIHTGSSYELKYRLETMLSYVFLFSVSEEFGQHRHSVALPRVIWEDCHVCGVLAFCCARHNVRPVLHAKKVISTIAYGCGLNLRGGKHM